METRCRSSSFGSAPLSSSTSDPRSDSPRGRGETLQSSSGDGEVKTSAATGSGGAPQSSAATARDARINRGASATGEEEPAAIGGGIFKAISDAASQEGPLQGKAFDSYAFGPPVSFSLEREERKELGNTLSPPSESRPAAATSLLPGQQRRGALLPARRVLSPPLFPHLFFLHLLPTCDNDNSARPATPSASPSCACSAATLCAPATRRRPARAAEEAAAPAAARCRRRRLPVRRRPPSYLQRPPPPSLRPAPPRRPPSPPPTRTSSTSSPSSAASLTSRTLCWLSSTASASSSATPRARSSGAATSRGLVPFAGGRWRIRRRRL